MPVLRLQVKHTSVQQEAGKARPVEVETELVAYGKVAQELAKAQPGNRLKLTGFIDRKGVRNPQLELHVVEFGILAPA
jgi:primosomal replication protein N